METTLKDELEFAAGEAIFGMQLEKDKAVSFVIRNVGQSFEVSEIQAEEAVDRVMIEYKIGLGG